MAVSRPLYDLVKKTIYYLTKPETSKKYKNDECCSFNHIYLLTQTFSVHRQEVNVDCKRSGSSGFSFQLVLHVIPSSLLMCPRIIIGLVHFSYPSC